MIILIELTSVIIVDGTYPIIDSLKTCVTNPPPDDVVIRPPHKLLTSILSKLQLNLMSPLHSGKLKILLLIRLSSWQFF